MRSFLLLFALMTWSGAAHAELEAAVIQDIMDGARLAIPMTLDEHGKRRGPETSEEKKHNIIPLDDARPVVRAGSRSAIAEWCGIDSDENFKKLMRHERSKKKWNDKQISYISLIHGFMMGHLEKELAKKPCSAQEKQQIEKAIANSPG